RLRVRALLATAVRVGTGDTTGVYAGGRRRERGGAARFARPRLPSAHRGGVSERSKERDWKSRMCRKVHRGFKSLSLRLVESPPRGGLSRRKCCGTMPPPEKWPSG